MRLHQALSFDQLARRCRAAGKGKKSCPVGDGFYCPIYDGLNSILLQGPRRQCAEITAQMWCRVHSRQEYEEPEGE